MVTVDISSRDGIWSARLTNPGQKSEGDDVMPRFVIERNFPGAGKLSPSGLKAISQKSCSVLDSMGPSIQWVHSYVTDDEIYCVYIAGDEAAVRKHAAVGGFPADQVSQVRTMIDPVTAE